MGSYYNNKLKAFGISLKTTGSIEIRGWEKTPHMNLSAYLKLVKKIY